MSKTGYRAGAFVFVEQKIQIYRLVTYGWNDHIIHLSFILARFFHFGFLVIFLQKVFQHGFHVFLD